MSFVGEYKQRVITAVALLGAVFLLGIIDSFFLMWLAFGVVYLFAFKEALGLYAASSSEKLFFIATLIWLLALFYPNVTDIFILVALIYASMLAYGTKVDLKSFMPLLYPTVGMLFILGMYSEFGVMALLWLLVVVATTDIGAFVVGKSIGKTPFSSSSPNKTVEGVAGGIVFALIAGGITGAFILDSFVSVVIITVATSIASVFGDLYESSLKRSAGVKDSGTILPGHGGVLDRIDGYLFGSIVMLILIRGLA